MGIKVHLTKAFSTASGEANCRHMVSNHQRPDCEMEAICIASTSMSLNLNAESLVMENKWLRQQIRIFMR